MKAKRTKVISQREADDIIRKQTLLDIEAIGKVPQGKWDWNDIIRFMDALEPIMPRAHAYGIALYLDRRWMRPSFRKTISKIKPRKTRK